MKSFLRNLRNVFLKGSEGVYKVSNFWQNITYHVHKLTLSCSVSRTLKDFFWLVNIEDYIKSKLHYETSFPRPNFYFLSLQGLTTETVSEMCPVKNVFWKNSENSQEKTYVIANFLLDALTDVFLRIFRNIFRPYLFIDHFRCLLL